MKSFLFALILSIVGFAHTQGEADKWVVSPNALVDFSNGQPVITGTIIPTDFAESSSCISDENGSLLFYSDGEIVWGGDNNVLPNGNDLSPANWDAVATTTQGSLFVNKPNHPDQYYLISLSFNGILSYSVLDRTLNNGIGDVVSKHNILIKDTLTEKMAVTKHCNNNDFWLVVIKYKNISPSIYTLEFLSYLVTANGINPSPVRSNVEAVCLFFGEMKFNNAGNELAFAEANTLVLCDFDSSTGSVNLKKQIDLQLDHGYGIEYAPNDSLIYINEKQYDLHSETLTHLLTYKSGSHMQRAIDGKIYCFNYPEDEVSILSLSWGNYGSGTFQLTSNLDAISQIASIELPDLSGSACNYVPNTITINHPGINKNYINLPYMAAYHFNHKPSDFSYSVPCVNVPVDFFLENGYTNVDSLRWSVSELGLSEQGDTVYFVFPDAGEWTVSCVVYQNGVAITSVQCINICGKESIKLPEYIDLCDYEPFEINPISTCGISYLWNTGDTTSAVFVQKEGVYILEMKTECGVFSDTMTVQKSEKCIVLTEIPNVITANNDGVNDFFVVNYKNAVAFNYSIVNRWGNLIKDGEVTVPPSSIFNWNSTLLWDGTTQGGLNVVDATYFYNILFKTISGSIIEKFGFLQVIN